MNYYGHQFIPIDKTLELFFIGCTRHCSECQNENLWYSEENTNTTPEEITNELDDYITIAKQVHIIGGEPLEQPLDELIELIKLLKEKGFSNIVLFTGNDLEELRLLPKEIFFDVDYIKFGSYKKDDLNTNHEKDNTLNIELASNNQHLCSKECLLSLL